MKKLFIVALLSFFVVGSSQAQTKLQDSLRLHHTVTEGKSYKVRATVKKIYREENKITLQHSAIKGYMPAMTMIFPVKKPSILDGLHAGSKGIFTIFISKGLPSVTGVKIISGKK